MFLKVSFVQLSIKTIVQSSLIGSVILISVVFSFPHHFIFQGFIQQSNAFEQSNQKHPQHQHHKHPRTAVCTFRGRLYASFQGLEQQLVNSVINLVFIKRKMSDLPSNLGERLPVDNIIQPDMTPSQIIDSHISPSTHNIQLMLSKKRGGHH